MVEDNITQEKKCSKCKEWKLLTEFLKNKRKKDGLSCECKQCNSVRCKQYAENNKTKIIESKKAYHRENREKILLNAKRRYEKNQEKLLDQKKQYYKNNKEKIILKNKLYYRKNKSEILEQKKQYQENNKDIISLMKRANYKENKEEILTRNKLYREENKEELLKRKKKYYNENSERILEYKKDYHKTEQGKANSRKARHKRRVLKFQGTYEVFDSTEIFERDGYRCQICGKKTRPDYKNYNHPLYPNLDHIIPISKGGDHTRENTQCLCHQCNMEKGNSYDGEDFKFAMCE